MLQLDRSATYCYMAVSPVVQLQPTTGKEAVNFYEDTSSCGFVNVKLVICHKLFVNILGAQALEVDLTNL